METIIRHEYKLWKKNVPFIYDTLISKALDWPSLSVDWLGPSKEATPDHITHRLVVGTHTDKQE